MQQSVIDLCESLASNRLLVQGAGGNVSWKDGDVLWIKASGSRLADACQQPIFIPFNLSLLRVALGAGDFGGDPVVLNDSSLRPSIETSLHAQLPQRVVVHLHAVEILAHLVRRDAREFLRARLPENMAWVLIDYWKPGAELAEAMAQELACAPATQVVFLGNHGVVICADNTDEIVQLLEQLTAALATVPRRHVKLTPPNALARIQWFGPYRRILDDDVQQLALDVIQFDQLAHAWALYPEQVVFLGASAACFEYHASVPFGLTGAVFVRGVGVFASTKFSANQMAQLRCYYDVMTRQSLPTQFRVLSDAEVAELVNRNAEKYRLQRAKLLMSVTSCMQDLLAVLDIGKTNTKLSIVDISTGLLLRVVQRVNRAIHAIGMNQLDIAGLNAWLIATLAGLPEKASISAFVPVGHGADCVLIGANGKLLAAPDYEDPCFNKIAGAYGLLRDPYGMTYSPRLPDEQNLGAQLFYLESKQSEVFATTHHIFMLPQYWAWRFCGIAATEVSSLGAHTDLWLPEHGEYSPMAHSRGWCGRMLPMRAANEVLGSVTSEITEATGMSTDCKIFCGAHDSNISWQSHRNKMKANATLTVISSGTWTIAMKGAAKLERLDEYRDMRSNVDVFGSPIATARFMGGREYAAIAGDNSASPTLEDLRHVISIGAMAWPSFSSAGGPFQGRVGAISDGGGLSPAGRSALATLHVALVIEVMLELLGDSNVVVVDGPLASNLAFSGLLQILCPTTSVVVSRVSSRAAEGARALVPCNNMGDTTNFFSQVDILPLAGFQRNRNMWRSSIGIL